MFKVFKTTGIEGSYNISSTPTFVNDRCWSVFSAKHKTTKKQYSVWQFNKKECENRLIDSGVINKQNKKMILDDIYERLKSFVSNQSKLKHPNFLTVIEPFEDHKSRILFVTEYVKGDLKSIDKTELDEITITKGVLQVSNGLKFLHEQMKSVHMNMSPNSIVITDSFDWKITGLSFMESIDKGIMEKFIDPMDSRLPDFLAIDFRFSSPNLISKHKVDYINDIFSLCLLIYYLFQYELLLKCPHSSSISDYERQVAKLNNILRDTLNTKHALFSRLPDYYYSVLIDALKRTQESNTDVIQLNETYTIDNFITSNIFNNPLIKMLNTLDEFSTMPINEKVEVLNELQSKIEKFPKTLIFNKIIPTLTNVIDLNLFKKNKPTSDEEQLLIGATENLIILSKNLSQLTFSEKVFPFIQNVLTDLDFDGYKVILIKHLPNFQSFMKASRESPFNDTFTNFLLELFQRSVSNQDSLILQELVLQNIKIFLEFESYSTITSIIYPKIMTIYSTTTSLKVKNLAINSFVLMISGMNDKNLDDVIVIEKLIPLIQATSQTVYSNSKFLMNMVSLYETIYLKLIKSSGKSIQILKEEIEYFDLIMNIGFEIWKLTKFVKYKDDLDTIYKVWNGVENYLKRELESKVINEPRSVQQQSSNLESKVSVSTPQPRVNSDAIPRTQQNSVKPPASQYSVMASTNSQSQSKNNERKPAAAQYNSMSPSNSQYTVMKPTTPSSSSFPVMKTSNVNIDSSSSLSGSQMKPRVQPIKLTKKPVTTPSTPQLTFGQSQSQPPPASQTSIDWSNGTTNKLNTYSVMQPMKAKPLASNKVANDNDDDDWDKFTSASKNDDKWASLI